MKAPTRRLFAILLAAALLVSACASDDDQVLPFDAVLVDIFGTDDIDDYQYDIERDAARRMAECMRRAGFEFVEPAPLPRQPTRAELASYDYVVENGFGIVTTFLSWLDSDNIADQQRNPNLDYLQTLTAAEIDEYLIALEGPEPEPGQLSEDSGCQGEATTAYENWSRFFDALPHFTGMAEERDTHPLWVEARLEWQACMTERGYDYGEPDVVRSDVSRRMNDLVGELYPDGQLPVVFTDGRWTVDPELEPLLDQIAEFERSVAIANFECTETVAERQRTVDREVQQGFVDRNQDIIDDLLAASTSPDEPDA